MGDPMTQVQWVAAALVVGALLLAWRLVDGALKLAARKLKGEEASRAVKDRLLKVELALTRIPENAATTFDLDTIEKRVADLAASMGGLQVTIAAESDRLRAQLITREMAERIVNQVNAVTLDVTALKEWQQTIENTDELATALQGQAIQEKSA